MKILKNQKFVLTAAILLGVAAVSSSAVAAYVITGGQQSGSADLDPSDIVIENKIANLDVDPTDTDLLFQPLSAVSTGRLQSTGNGDLTAELTLTFDSETKEAIPDLEVTIETKDGTNDAVTKGYIVNPENVPLTLTYNDFGGSTGNYTYTLTLTWSWGAEFGNTDPCTYYNTGGDGHGTDDSTMVSKLNDFKTAVGKTSFTVNIAPKAKA